MKGWVYIITNKSMPSLLKVGFSTKDPALRARELYTTGVPHPYVVEYDALVNNPRNVEQKAHFLLKAYQENKEWFRCDISTAIFAIKQAADNSVISESNKDDLIISEILNEVHHTKKNTPSCAHMSIGSLQLEFWKQLCEFAKSNNYPLGLRCPSRAQKYCDIRIGRSDCHVSMAISVRENKISCELYISESKLLFNTFSSNKKSLENALGIRELLWDDRPNNACRIMAFHDFDFENQEREEAFTWLLQTANKFKNVFSK